MPLAPPRHLVVAIALLAWAPVPAAVAGPPDARDVLRELGFDDDDLADLRAGEVVAGEVEETSDKELAVAVAMLVPVPVEAVFGVIRSGRTLGVAPDVILYRDLGDGAAGGLAALGYGPAETGEVERLLEVEAGSDFNFAPDEIRHFRALAGRLRDRGDAKSPDAREAVSAGYRAVLSDRYRRYRSGGTDAIAPYARDDDETADPGGELAGAAAQHGVLRKAAPALARAVASYPREAAPGIEHRFYVIKQRVDDRPAFILAHRAFARGQGAAFVVERQFYVGHSYNSLDAVTGCLPLGPRTLVFRVTRTSTDQVAGIGRRVRHGLGRRLARAAVIDHFEAIQRGFRVAERP